jgi:PAS domain S-box-containing protein
MDYTAEIWTWLALALMGVVFSLLWLDARRRFRRAELIVAAISPDVLLVVSPDRRITSCNGSVRAMFGYTPREVTGQETDLMYFDRRTTSGNEIRDALDRHGFHIGEATGRRKGGETFPLEIITGRLASVPGAVILLRDITQRKKDEQALQEARAIAEEASRAKGETLAELERSYARLKAAEDHRDALTHMIVHDLKSPLVSVKGYLGLIKATAGDRLKPEDVSLIEEGLRLSGFLLERVGSLLDLGRLERNEMPLTPVACDLVPLVEAAVALVRPQTGGLRIQIRRPAQPVIVQCDGDTIQRVILNLVDNAVKYSPSGGEVTVGISALGSLARLAVSDQGAGIPAEHHERIFDRYGQYQAKRHSTGLGLTFCRLAVEAHGGTIGVESEPGRGSTFWFTVPLTQPADPII